MRDGEHEEFSLRRIAVPAYGPSTLWAVGNGATLPIIALTARQLGASVGVAALFVGIVSAAEFACAVPAGVFVDRVGETRALIIAGLADAVASALALLARDLWVLGAALFLLGPTGAVFLLARQTYLSAAAPPHLRARALSTLGGVTRIGLFLGPLIGAPVVARWDAQAGFAVEAVTSLLAAVLAALAADLSITRTAEESTRERSTVRAVVAGHRRVFLTVGVGVLAIGLARSSRAVAVPLWAEHIGLTAAQTSLVFGFAFAVEALLFYPAGSVMDRRGRVFVAVPMAVILGACLVALPLTHTLVGVGVVSVIMGLGNGLGSGIVMTLGADAAPEHGQAQFFGVWRVLVLVGQNGAAIVVGAIAAVASIGAASVTVGVLALAGGGWLWRWLPEYDPRRALVADDRDGVSRAVRSPREAPPGP